MANYAYNAFISYKRTPVGKRWMDELFYPLFEEYLNEYTDENLPIFKDTEEIAWGDSFPSKIRNALIHSKCMISICTPSYFKRSEWCMREFSVMKYRADKLGFYTDKNPNGLVFPILFRTIDPYPPFIRNVQILDYTNFNVAEIKQSGSEYLQFQRKLETDVKKLADFINQVPPWNAEWEKAEWIDQPYNLFVQQLIEYKQVKPQLSDTPQLPAQ
jgi:hypothetical protein